MVRTGWEKDMEALCAYTEKNWWKTGNRKVATAVTGSLSLENPENTKDKKGADKSNRTC
tara:strand:- start:1110 stop:1286 length:177 start_codon:yes stop_codon:yes gene_type:complete